MKYSVIILTTVFALSACSSSSVKKESVEQLKPAKNMQVVAEICMTAPKKEIVDIVTTERSGTSISSHSYKAVLENKTTDNMSIFSSVVGNSDSLTYVTVENILDSSTYYLFKRNFNNYQVNQWGKWESPDYLFKEGSQYNFLAMSNSPIDGTSNLLKINFKNQPEIKVRFQLTTGQKTKNVENSSEDTIIARKVSACS